MLDHALKQNGFHRWFGWPEATTRSSIGGAPKPLMAPRQDHKAAKIQANRIKKPLTIVLPAILSLQPTATLSRGMIKLCFWFNDWSQPHLL